MAHPDPSRCPICDARLIGARCDACGTDLSGPLGQDLWRIDRDLYRLSLARAEVVGRLTGVRLVPGPRMAPPPPTWAAQIPTAPLPPAPAPDPGPQASSLLLGLGVALLVVAAIIFAAVSWGGLGAIGQGALLVGLTLIAGGATTVTARRGLRGTAEALGVLTVVMAPLVAQAVRLTLDLPSIEDRTWSNWASWTWWPAVIVAIGAAALVFGRAVRVRSPEILGVALVQVGLPIWIGLAPVHPALFVVVLAAQALAVATGPGAAEQHRSTGWLWMAGATVAWIVAVLVAAVVALAASAGSADHLASVGGLAAVATAAAGIAWRWRRHPAWVDVTTAASTSVAFAAVARALTGTIEAQAVWPTVGVAAAAGLLAADRIGGPRRSVVRWVSWAVAWLASLPVLFAIGVTVIALTSTDEPWHRVASGRIDLAFDGGRFGPLWVSVVAGLAALAAGLAAEARRWRPAALRAAALGLTAVAALTVPPLLQLQLGTVVTLSLSTAAVLAALAWWSPAPRQGSLGAGGALAVAVVWSIGVESLELLAVGTALVLGVLAILRAMDLGDAGLGGAGAVLAAGALATEAGLCASATVGEAAWSWAAVSISASAAALALVSCDLGRATLRAHRSGLAADDRPPPPLDAPPAPDGTGSGADVRLPVGAAVATAGGSTLMIAHVLGLLAIEGAGRATALTVALATGVAALTTIAVLLRRADSGWWVWVSLAGVEATALVVLRLADAGVVTPEAYSLPIAALLALVTCSLAADRRGRFAGSPSWMLEGPALAMALAPTVLVALGDPGLTRQMAGLVVGLVLLGGGVTVRRRAPVDVGAAALAVLGVQGLVPYAQEVPRWISFGTVGAVLVLLGATFEQRRRDVRQARRHYSGLQ